MFLSFHSPPPFPTTNKTQHHNFPQSPPPPLPKPSLLFQDRIKKTTATLRSSSYTASETLAKSAIQRISEKLRSLGYLDDDPASAVHRPSTGPGSAGEIFIPTPREIPTYRVGHTLDDSWSTPEHPVPDPGRGATITRFRDLWRREQKRVAAERAQKDKAPPTVAELTLAPEELKRLRSLGIRLEKRLKVGKAGITEGIVNGIHERWRRSELVKIKCEDLCRMNMKRTHAILERKTGGLVVWRSGTIIILYRGANYQYPYYFDSDQKKENVDEVALSSSVDCEATNDEDAKSFMPSANSSPESLYRRSCSSLVIGVGSPKKVRLQLDGEVRLQEEADKLLDGLGPRFTDWWGCDPLPVDADLLPAVVPGFRKPFRLLPFGVKPKLTDREMTVLRRLGRPLPCHFALGRNRNLQGLAMSMIKLWEKCEIVKIAIKRGVQNTNSELMAEELKQLTGATLLSRDKDFIVFYRGKDFLPPAVSVAIEERRNSGINKEKKNKVEKFAIAATNAFEPEFAGTTDINGLKYRAELRNASDMERRLISANMRLHRIENKLSQAIEKKEQAEKLLADLEKSVEPPKLELDKEAISEEERYMLRKVGLGMKPFLLLGRRGVFDGTVENMHLHWKYRELVKLISKDRCIQNVKIAAQTLEAESGGILVAVERVNKGHAIIVYRGKNYQRPVNLRPKTLLTKREAMKCSLEAQRRESLKLHVLSLSRNIDQLKHRMANHVLSIGSMVPEKFEKMAVIVETNNETGLINRDKDSVDSECIEQIQSPCIQIAGHKAQTVDNASSEISSDLPWTSIQDKLTCTGLKDDSSNAELVQSFSEVRGRSNVPDSDRVCGPGESQSDPNEQAETSFSINNGHLHSKDSDLSFGTREHKSNSSDYENTFKEESLTEIPYKAAPLSNRERLILRKQALKMKKRPVLAVGRNNVISGVAKTIKTHFRKHPLAIVNIKGRARGTSVQELIFELEQATGAVLVSREPNKVILYRGWGEGETSAGVKAKNNYSSPVAEDEVSAQLIAAVKLECGIGSRSQM